MNRIKEYRALVRYLQSLGWQVQQTSQKHIKCTKPGCQPLFFGASGDPRAMKNVKAQVRRAERQLMNTR